MKKIILLLITIFSLNTAKAEIITGTTIFVWPFVITAVANFLFLSFEAEVELKKCIKKNVKKIDNIIKNYAYREAKEGPLIIVITDQDGSQTRHTILSEDDYLEVVNILTKDNCSNKMTEKFLKDQLQYPLPNPYPPYPNPYPHPKPWPPYPDPYPHPKPWPPY